MRVLVTGGRNFSNRTLLVEALDRLHSIHRFSVLIHGDAKGADRLAGEWAKENGIQLLVERDQKKGQGGQTKLLSPEFTKAELPPKIRTTG